MATHFRWYPASEDEVIPWNARYSFPSQANKVEKMTPRIPPKNGGGTYLPGNTIRLEFPAQGYVNGPNTVLEFDVTLYPYSTAQGIVRFQNNIQSIFKQVRLMYGSTPLETILYYNQIVRSLTEWTSTNQEGKLDQTSINEGIGGVKLDNVNGFAGLFNVRQRYIQGSGYLDNAPTGANFINTYSGFAVGALNINPGSGNAFGVTRRYCVNLALGLFTQDKLIPTKFMASQLAIELTLDQPEGCIFAASENTSSTGSPTYMVNNVNLIPEILNFDASYDAVFLTAMRESGIPIKFSSWHTFSFSSQASSKVSLQIQERSRSVKSVFAVQRRATPQFTSDTHATFFDTALTGLSTLQNFQFRIGGRYFPSAPVECCSQSGGLINNGGAEAFVELQKALNTLGDYRLSCNASAANWAIQADSSGVLPCYDYKYAMSNFDTNGRPVYFANDYEVGVGAAGVVNGACGGAPSGCFAMATNLEASNGFEISGLNAEEQSDICLNASWGAPQVTGSTNTSSELLVFVYYDAMIVLKENNVVELVQ